MKAVGFFLGIRKLADTPRQWLTKAKKELSCVGELLGRCILTSALSPKIWNTIAHWRSHLHDIGGVTDKHGLSVPLVNLYTDELGNSALPAKLSRARAAFRVKSAVVAALLLITALGVAFWMLRRSQEKLMNATAATPHKSIAVLPFEDLSEDKANAYFADGTQNETFS